MSFIEYDKFDMYAEEMSFNPRCGAHVGNGWLLLVDELIIQLIMLGFKPEDQIDQIKEKFGGLRFYVCGDISPEMHELISAAEKESFEICENCGEPGRNHGGHYWIKTLCDTCEKARCESISHE
jgi:hypothetical protein